MSEKRFQFSVSKLLEDTFGYHVVYNDPVANPGIPDLLIGSENVYIYAELKYIYTERNYFNISLLKFFKKTQPIFYLEYINKGHDNIYLILKLKNLQNQSRYSFIKMNKKLALKMCRGLSTKLMYEYLLDQTISKEFSTIEELINRIRHEFYLLKIKLRMRETDTQVYGIEKTIEIIGKLTRKKLTEKELISLSRFVQVRTVDNKYIYDPFQIERMISFLPYFKSPKKKNKKEKK